MNIKINKIGKLAILPLAALLSTNILAFGMMEVENWQFQFSGNVNAFVVSTDCKAGGAVIAGGLACGSNNISDRATNIRTGLLPSWFGFRANRNTDNDGFKTGVTLGFQPGVDSGPTRRGAVSGQDSALGNNTVNFRQVFFDISSPEFGTVKIGRDLGLFGGDAILSDMTLLGVGTVSDLTKRGGNTSLGRIGVGYIYADWKAQLQYTSPDFDGLTYSVALVDPWNAGGLSASSLASSMQPITQKNDNFGFEGKVNYTSGDTKFWAGFIAQEVEGTIAAVGNVAATNVSYDARGYDAGVKFTVDDLTLTGYFYDGEGIGTTGFLLDGSDAAGNKRDSDGYYIQATYKPNKTKYGLSFGESNLDLATGDAAAAGNNLIKTNESVVAGIYHSFNDALTLVAEYTKTESEAHSGIKAEEKSFAVGGIMFF